MISGKSKSISNISDRLRRLEAEEEIEEAEEESPELKELRARYAKYQERGTEEWRLDFEEYLNVLRETPEERYQEMKQYLSFHELSYFDQYTDDTGKAHDIIKEYGCGRDGKGCVPECRYYHDKGRIEDKEVIANHEKYHRERIL